MIRALHYWLLRRVAWAREPDFYVGGRARPYLRRWWLIPRNPVLNIYLHHFLRDDDDRALHDHPWWWVSILLSGRYVEHTIRSGGVHARREYAAGSVRAHGGSYAHRIELVAGAPCWTLFITGPVIREWGFHCPRGWVPWGDFVADEDNGSIGAGCEAMPRKPESFWRVMLRRWAA